MLMRCREAMKARREHGAVLVETALFLPILMVLVFGVIEFSSAFQASSILADATRAAGREGGAQGGRDANPPDEPLDYVDFVADAGSIVLQRLPNGAHPEFMMVYKANDDGYPGASGNTTLNFTTLQDCAVSDECIELTWDDDDKRFVRSGGSWPPADHERCVQPYDRIGVAIFMSFEPLTGLFTPILRQEAPSASNVNSGMVDHAVFVFEPAEPGECT